MKTSLTLRRLSVLEDCIRFRLGFPITRTDRGDRTDYEKLLEWTQAQIVKRRARAQEMRNGG